VSARTKKTQVGERLPYLLSKLKAPRVLERLEQTAERARAEQWPYEQFLEALPFPRRDGDPWRLHDYQNWRRRTWHPARTKAGIKRLPPYDLRHAFAPLQIRASMSIPELAEQMGHSPQMTVGTYAHVIRELKGQPSCPSKSRSSELAWKTVDAWWTSTRSEGTRGHRRDGRKCLHICK
jgi:integrase